MSDLNLKRFMKLIAFIACIAIAFALVVGKILGAFGVNATVVGAINTVGVCLAYIVTMVTAFGFVQNKRKPVWAIVYAIAVTVIIVMVILNMF